MPNIKLELSGFEELQKKLEEAGGNIDDAVDACVRRCAPVLQNELKAQMRKANVSDSLIGRMPAPKIEKEGNRTTATVGYEKGAYNPENLSDGYKVVFLNYGTPRRKPTKIKARGFIQAAKKSAKSKIKKEQQNAIDEIMRGLNI